MKKNFICIMATLLFNVVCSLQLQALPTNTADGIVAVVNGEPIFKSDIDIIVKGIIENAADSEQTEQKKKELENMVLDHKIIEKILNQETKKEHIKVNEKEKKERLDEIKNNFQNYAEFIAELQKENMSVDEFKKKLADQIAVIKLFKKKVEPTVKIPTEADANILYDKIIAQINGVPGNLPAEEKSLVSNLVTTFKKMFGEQVRVRQIFVSLPKGAKQDTLSAAQEKVATIKKELQRQTFSNVATQYSDDPASRSRNGDLGIVAKGDLLPALDKAAFSMKVGDYTKEPIKTDIGYFFIKVDEKRAKRDITFDDSKRDLLEFLAHINASTAQNGYIDKLKAKSNIKINKN
jgi:parvulin-like peptidyl-prolyl isomerase